MRIFNSPNQAGIRRKWVRTFDLLRLVELAILRAPFKKFYFTLNSAPFATMRGRCHPKSVTSFSTRTSSRVPSGENGFRTEPVFLKALLVSGLEGKEFVRGCLLPGGPKYGLEARPQLAGRMHSTGSVPCFESVQTSTRSTRDVRFPAASSFYLLPTVPELLFGRLRSVPQE